MNVLNGIKCITINPQNKVNVFSSKTCCVNINNYIKRQNRGDAILVVYNIFYPLKKKNKPV